ncbi:MAG: hypothetical protein CBD27_03645 [Rhodospirillaceae bacterium TMED167]|nr:hypothetical protein [Rhodospirillaceae bacterium]OUW29006.1 MAG: hypothetical protein CBD27_03645 [Rhodospirillaceae bacterium TMED167]
MGYRDAATRSYATFAKPVRDGIIPERMRFMVGLPTPLSAASFYAVPQDRDMFQQAYARALGQEF